MTKLLMLSLFWVPFWFIGNILKYGGDSQLLWWQGVIGLCPAIAVLLTILIKDYFSGY